MPNNYSQSVRLRHISPRIMKSFIEFLEEKRKLVESNDSNGYGLFQYFKPMPQEFINDNSSDERWYAWRNANWGTKWDAYELQFMVDTSLGDDFGAVWLTFATAWSPPVQLWEYLADLGWEIMAMGHNDGRGWMWTNLENCDIATERDE